MDGVGPGLERGRLFPTWHNSLDLGRRAWSHPAPRGPCPESSIHRCAGGTEGAWGAKTGWGRFCKTHSAAIQGCSRACSARVHVDRHPWWSAAMFANVGWCVGERETTLARSRNLARAPPLGPSSHPSSRGSLSLPPPLLPLRSAYALWLVLGFFGAHVSAGGAGNRGVPEFVPGGQNAHTAPGSRARAVPPPLRWCYRARVLELYTEPRAVAQGRAPGEGSRRWTRMSKKPTSVTPRPPPYPYPYPLPFAALLRRAATERPRVALHWRPLRCWVGD